MKKRMNVFFLILAAFALIITGCGSGGSGTDTAAKEQAPSDAKQAPGQPAEQKPEEKKRKS